MSLLTISTAARKERVLLLALLMLKAMEATCRDSEGVHQVAYLNPLREVQVYM